MIVGSVYNNGRNYGSQAGNVITGGLFVQGHFAHGAMIAGYAVNNGYNAPSGSQAGNVITGGSFWKF